MILITYNIYSFNNFNKKIDNIYRHETNELFKIFSTKNIKIKNLSLLTFDTKIMTWAMLNDIKDINVLDGLFSPRSNELTDISEQRKRFQNEERKKERLYKYKLPQAEVLYNALEKGIPPSAGIALGIERLLLAITKKDSFLS